MLSLSSRMLPGGRGAERKGLSELIWTGMRSRNREIPPGVPVRSSRTVAGLVIFVGGGKIVKIESVRGANFIFSCLAVLYLWSFDFFCFHFF